jgi:hypothetical protein
MGSSGTSGLDGEFIGTFNSLSDLLTAYPTPINNYWAFVKDADPTILYIYRPDPSGWVAETITLPSGTSGTSGSDGSSGTTGSDGSSGTTGSDGTSGTSGSSGSNGSSGSSGSNGTDGTSAQYAAVYIAETAPTTGTNGKFWFNDNEGTLYIEYADTNGTNWIPVNDLVGADGTSGTSGTSANLSGYVVLTQVSQSLNFVDDTSAASGGVPLGGLYRNGNIIQIRIV